MRTESTIDPAVVRNVLQLLAAAQLLDAQHGEPSSEEGADSSKAADVLTRSNSCPAAWTVKRSDLQVPRRRTREGRRMSLAERKKNRGMSSTRNS